MSMKKRVAILISGRGSNMTKLVEAAAEADYPAEIVGVLSDVADAPGLHFAAGRDIAARSIARADFASSADHEAAIEAELAGLGAEIVCLAGYMRLLSASFVGRWQGRMLNIHPSLLPSFRGLHPHRQALDAGVKLHGCSVHFVTAEVDGGPIVAQVAVPVLAEDSENRLAARVLKAEHELYPLALHLVASGKASMRDGRTVFADLHEDERTRARLFSPASANREIDFEALARVTP